jgi:hypothetical protein
MRAIVTEIITALGDIDNVKSVELYCGQLTDVTRIKKYLMRLPGILLQYEKTELEKQDTDYRKKLNFELIVATRDYKEPAEAVLAGHEILDNVISVLKATYRVELISDETLIAEDNISLLLLKFTWRVK